MSVKANIPGEVTKWQKHWSIAPEITFLNHGAFGACPKVVLAEQQRLRSHIEEDPVQFIFHELEPLLDNARSKLAEFVGANAEDLVFIPNATTGVNTVLRSLHFQPGDELLTTELEYNASRNALDFVGDRSGAKIVVAPVSFPLESSAQIVQAVMQQVSPKTKLVLLDHITSQTALIFPIKQLICELTKLGIDTLIDGAQAPGNIPLNLSELGATYYTGNCHKWLLGPKGAAFLYVRSDKQPQIRPLSISHGANSPRTDKSRFQLEFDWMGTDDPTAYLSVPTALDFIKSQLDGGWAELMEKNHHLAATARQILCEELGVALPCPDEAIGSMASIFLPKSVEQFPANQLQNALYHQYKIQVAIFYFVPTQKLLVRISAQIYNTEGQYYKLAKALKELLN